jgi:hypothetical protein
MTQHAWKRALPALLLIAVLAGCGGGGSGTGSGASPGDGAGGSGGYSGGGSGGSSGGGTGGTGSPVIPPPAALLGIAPCAPGAGTDYQVGPGPGQLAKIEDVPWEALQAGDTVRIFHRPTPYAGKFMIAAKGTVDKPVRVCGVPGPAGERPIIDGADAVTRTQLVYSNDDSGINIVHQTRSVIVVKPLGTDEWEYFPEFIQIDGLEIRGATPGNHFTDSHGTVREYDPFGACIWLERGHNIALLNNEIHNCTNGIFSKSTDYALEGNDPTEYSVTKNIRIAFNYIHDNGVVGDDHEHNSYVQSVNVLYEFNHYGPLRAGSGGSALKDRSVNAVIRYNRIEEGARSLDLVEAEDYPLTAMANPLYRQTWVYGNQIFKNADTGVAIHYGGDHSTALLGDNWGENIFRKGTLYFFNNSVILTGGITEFPYIFQLATTEEHAEVWNNVFVFRDATRVPGLRTDQDIGADWVAGGTINLGKNWITAGWAVNDVDHPVPGPVTGTANMISTGPIPIDVVTFAPVAGAAAIDAGQAPPAGVPNVPVDYQLSGTWTPVPRPVNGSAIDFGAIEK